MSDRRDGAPPRGTDGGESWEKVLEEARLRGQALIDALERRAQRLDRRKQRSGAPQERNLKLMD